MTGLPTYTCDHCKQEFMSDRPDEEAEKEHQEVFGEPVGEDTGVLCDDCWKEFIAWFNSLPDDKKRK